MKCFVCNTPSERLSIVKGNRFVYPVCFRHGRHARTATEREVASWPLKEKID